MKHQLLHRGKRLLFPVSAASVFIFFLPPYMCQAVEWCEDISISGMGPQLSEWMRGSFLQLHLPT